MNALTHGLTSCSPVLATEDPAAYQSHCRQFFDEYQPATPTETQLTQELADTAWRLNRIPHLEAALLDRADLDIVDAHRALATLGLHYQRLSRQFQKTWTPSAKSNPSAAASKSANSSVPPPSWNSINAKASPTTRLKMGSFFRGTKSRPTRDA
jgi:hypothetical protein